MDAELLEWEVTGSIIPASANEEDISEDGAGEEDGSEDGAGEEGGSEADAGNKEGIGEEDVKEDSIGNEEADQANIGESHILEAEGIDKDIHETSAMVRTVVETESSLREGDVADSNEEDTNVKDENDMEFSAEEGGSETGIGGKDADKTDTNQTDTDKTDTGKEDTDETDTSDEGAAMFGPLGENTASSTADDTERGTYITADGILHISEHEEAESLTVTVALKSNPELTATAVVTVTAKDTFAVTVAASPEDGGTVEGEGSVEDGGSVTIKAVPKEGYRFLHWKEDEEVMAQTAECMISNIMEPRHFVAYFEVDKTALEAAITKAEELEKSDYDPEDYAVLEAALREAREVLADSEAGPEAVSGATAKLQEAMAALTGEAPGPGTDVEAAKAALNALITTAKELNESDYTPESYGVLKAALEKAEELMKESDPGLEEVNQAKAGLQAAIDSLKKADESGSDDEKPGDYGEVLPEDVPEDKKIPEGLWIAGIAEEGYAYTGSAIKPAVRVYDGKTLLKEKADYTISYKNNVKAADPADPSMAAKLPTITVTGKGNYTGKETATYKILSLDIGTDAFGADDMAIACTNKAQKPMPALFWNAKSLKKNTDYTVTYYDADRNELPDVKEEGNYYIQLTGKGNFKGTREVNLSVTADLKLMGKVSVTKIKNQQYTGEEITPEITAKYGKILLTEGTDYDVKYSSNTEIGTAYAVLTGKGGYSGTKRVSFKITGSSISKAKVSVPEVQIYGGVDLEPAMQLSVRAGSETHSLTEGEDYTVSWQKNRNAGTATAVFSGKGGYVGTLKKTFKIKAFDIKEDANNRFSVIMEKESVPFAKGGAKPKLSVTFRKDDGAVQKLTEGTDYTVTYKYNTAVNDGSNEAKIPTAVIKGKGNFTGSKEVYYQVETQDLGELTLTAADKSYQNKKNVFSTKITITDLDGKTLKAGKDYDSKTVVYTYKNDTTVIDTTVNEEIVRVAGTVVGTTDIIPAETWIVVTVSASQNGNYTGNVSGEYRITKSSISSARVSIPKQTYTGKAVTLDEADITVKVKGKALTPDQYQIIPGSYKNNVKKGTASVTIRGLGDYGGTKTVKFTIKAKGFLWWGSSSK